MFCLLLPLDQPYLAKPYVTVIRREEFFPKMSPPLESTATQNIATIAFGILATLISLFTAWQGYRTWRKLYRHEGGRPTEVGLESRDYTPFNWPLKSLLIPIKQLASNSKATPHMHTPTFSSFRQTLHHQQKAHQLRQRR